MDSDSQQSNDTSVGVIFENDMDQESTEEPPMEEWSSLEFVEDYNVKKALYEEGNYNPREEDNVCGIYIAQSASSVFRHPYYCYPAVADPGILKALLKPDQVIVYPDDGQELYLSICREMNICPVKIFYRGLLETDIDLKYYGVNPNGVRAMAMALKYNKIVKTLRFTDNFLNDDACYHLGEMFTNNCTLANLDLSGCRIGPSGLMKLLAGLITNRSLKSLNLCGNDLGDAGIECLADAVFKGLAINVINLSRNNINGKGLMPLTLAFETFNKFTHWNLSWNCLYSTGIYNFLASVAESTKNLQEMDLSWNSLSGARVATGIKSILAIRTMKNLNLSNNKFEGEAIPIILGNLFRAKNLVSLNLSDNPMSPDDAILVINKCNLNSVKVSQVYMDNINVNMTFLKLLTAVKTRKPNIIITHGYVLNSYVVNNPDVRELVLNRADYLCQKSRNCTDIALLFLELQKNRPSNMLGKDFVALLGELGAPLDEDLINEIVNTFPGPKLGKGKTIAINLLVDYVQRKWPDRKLPPTPPPEPEPEPEPEPAPKKKSKNKK